MRYVAVELEYTFRSRSRDTSEQMMMLILHVAKIAKEGFILCMLWILPLFKANTSLRDIVVCSDDVVILQNRAKTHYIR